jgi:phosphatidylinositol alpha-1,6-mannosyltransferase
MSEPRAMTQPKFIIATHEFAPVRGGAATYAQELGVALCKAGAPAQIWAPDYCGRAQVEELACPVIRLRSGGTLGLMDTFQFARAFALRRREWERATVILASVGAHLAFMLMRPRDVRIISVLYGSEVLRFERNPIWRMLAKRFYQRAERVVTISEFTRSLIEKSFLHSSVGTIAMAPCAGSSAAAREVNVPPMTDGKVRVLTLARIHPRKGQLDTARALGRLPKSLRERVIYQMGGAGDADYLAQVRRACMESGVAFEYLGEVESSRLAEVYAACDIFAMSSRSLPRSVEGFGITYLDAGFHGKPVVGYRSGGVAEAVTDGETGLLVKEGDVAALAGALEKLISDAPLRVRLGAGGRRWSAQFSWAATARVFQGF